MRDFSAYEYEALRRWKEFEMRFPERLRRMSPDKWDVWFGTWGKLVEEVKADPTFKPEKP